MQTSLVSHDTFIWHKGMYISVMELKKSKTSHAEITTNYFALLQATQALLQTMHPEVWHPLVLKV